MENSLKACCDHIALIRENLVQMINAVDPDNPRLQRLNLAVEQLNNYETTLNQRFHLLMEIDPAIDSAILIDCFAKINQSLTDFKYSFHLNEDPNKFINYRPIDGYVK